MVELRIREYIDRRGKSHFSDWFNDLDAIAAAKVTAAKAKLQTNQTGNVEPVGEGVFEYKIDHGPGYRVYFGRDGEKLVLLISGGTKKTQQSDVQEAKGLWREYKERKAAARKTLSALRKK